MLKNSRDQFIVVEYIVHGSKNGLLQYNFTYFGAFTLYSSLTNKLQSKLNFTTVYSCLAKLLFWMYFTVDVPVVLVVCFYFRLPVFVWSCGYNGCDPNAECWRPYCRHERPLWRSVLHSEYRTIK